MTKIFQRAEDAIRQRFKTDGFRGKMKYDTTETIENDRWWYIPFCWVGCAGFIVNKSDLYVNWLGSGIKLELCFWGHDRGIFSDMVDFTFSQDTSKDLAMRLISKFQHMQPNSRGALPSYPVWYRDSEIPSAYSSQFPVFRNHFVWFAIPELFRACETEGLQFTCCLTAKA